MGKTKKHFPFGTYLRFLREDKGVSLRQVQNDTGIPNPSLSQLETGARKKIPGPDRLKKLANYYNVTTKELLTKAGYFDEENNRSG